MKFTFGTVMLKTWNKRFLRKRVNEEMKGISEIRLSKG